MKQNQIADVKINLTISKHSLEGLIALFDSKSNYIIHHNKERALDMADCIIDLMTEVKRAIELDDGKGD